MKNLLILLLIVVPACQSAPTVNNNSSFVKVEGAKYYEAKGVITEIRQNEGVVELKHEEIKDLMPAMTMMFYVSNKSELQNLKVADAVDFTLEDNKGAEKIVKIAKAK